MRSIFLILSSLGRTSAMMPGIQKWPLGWKKYKELFDEYRVKDEDYQHDLLACHEGLAFLRGTNMICGYEARQ